MSELRELGDRLGTDKGPHGYLEVYETLFAPWRDKEFTLLEIGVYQGLSLWMWEAWFPKANIWGVDWDPSCLQHTRGRVVVSHGDQGDTDFMGRLGASAENLSIVIDDGSHVGSDQIASFGALWPHLRPGGLYIIEDLQACFYDRYAPSATSFIHGFFESVNGRGAYPDVRSCYMQRDLCILEKGPLAGKDVDL